MKENIREALKSRILVLDGAMGTQVQCYNLTEEDFRGEIFAQWPKDLKGNNECLNLTRPDVVRKIYESYIAAGAEIIETNSFCANRVSQEEYGCQEFASRMAFESARIARQVADSTPGQVWVAGSVGPTGKSLTLSSDMSQPTFRAVDFDEMVASYSEQMESLAKGGVDIFQIETCFDALTVKAAIYAAKTVAPEIPIIISVAVSDRSGRTFTGQTMEAFYTAVQHSDMLAFGLNCSFGAAELEHLLENVSAIAQCPIIFYPNAGLPNEMGQYDETPQAMASVVRGLARKGLVNIIGGCCGTTPEHIRALREIADSESPRQLPASGNRFRSRLCVSGLECAVIDKEENNFTNIGERTNVAGSRKFAKLIAAGAYEEALQVAADQIEGGASIIDINMDDAMLDSKVEMQNFLRYIAGEPSVAKAALMIDSSHFETIIAGLKNAQGKCIVNSISLKEGEEIFLSHAAEIRRLGAAVVVMAFDEQGQATTYERKIEICSRAYKLLTEKVGYAPSDIIFDVNVLSVGTGLAEHRRYGVDFIEAVRWIKSNLKGSLTSGGISNLSFSFRGNNAVREAMHSAFLYYAGAAGLDMGIVNPSMLQVYDDIEPELLSLVEDVILDRREDATELLIEKAQALLAAKESAKESSDMGATADADKKLSAQQRVTQSLVKGRSTGLKEDLLECLDKFGGSAVKVIEGPLMEGMEKVGQLFGDGRMFLPQVVKSARIMRDAVEILEPYMLSDSHDEQQSGKPKIVIATVKGDVHDIGKNITAIVLRCNGFEVKDLGVMVPCDVILDEAEKSGADIVSASGLITPSLSRMEELCTMMKERGMHQPLFIGGATTSALHTAVKLAPLYDHVFYASDASASAVMAKRYLMDPQEFEMSEHKAQERLRELYNSRAQSESRGDAKAENLLPESGQGACCAEVKEIKINDIPCRELSIEELMPFFDWKMFFAIWGVKYVDMSLAQSRALKADAMALIERMKEQGGCVVRIAARFAEAQAEGDDIIAAGVRFPMLRQESGDHISLADFVKPSSLGSKSPLGLFAISVHRARHIASQCDCDCHVEAEYEPMLERSVRISLAEAASSWLDEQIRKQLPSQLNGLKICKPAAGYASCPDHSIKRDIMALLPDGEELGIRFTESCAMIPDASICGFAFVHPDAHYPEIRQLSAKALDDYALRRNFSEQEKRAFLGHLLR